MNEERTNRVGYSRAEYLSDVAVHALGLLIVIVGVPVLILAAYSTSGNTTSVAASVLYGICFAMMITASAVYNAFPQSKLEWLLKRLDHSAIYLKIAGSVTTFALIAGKGLLLVSGLWVAAALGIALKLYCPFKFRRVGLMLYLSMGWAMAIWGWGIFGALPIEATLLICLAGVLYTVGVAFYLWEQLPFHNTIWHLFVLVSSLILYCAAMIAILG